MRQISLVKIFGNKYPEGSQFVKYMIGGGVWFWSHYAAFAIFYSLVGFGWLLAKILSDMVGWTVNYAVQRYWAFSHPDLVKHSKAKMSARYAVVMASHVVLDYLIVGGLYYAGLTPYLGIFVAATLLIGWNWWWYKHWVFKTGS